MRLKLSKLSLILFFLAFIFLVKANTASAATLSLSPASGSVDNGATISVDVKLNTGADQIKTGSVAISYPADKLEAVAQANGELFDPAGSPYSFTLGIPAPTGAIGFTFLKTASPFPSGSSLQLARITFKAKVGSGTATVSFSSYPIAGTGSNDNMLSTDSGAIYCNVPIVPSCPSANNLSVSGGSYTLTGAPNPVPTADIKANGSDAPAPIANNTGVTISWTSSNAGSCTVTGISSTATSGSFPSGNLTASKTYTVNCGGATDQVAVNVQGKTPATTTTTTTKPTAYVATPTTTSGDKTAPKISNVTVSDITINSAKISWTTDEASNSIVEYSQTNEYLISQNLSISEQSATLTTTHSVTLPSSILQIGYGYTFRVRSIDGSGNSAQSDIATFRTKGYTVRLKIVDKDTGEPLTNVSVIFTNEKITKTTDNDGIVIFDDIANMDHPLKVSYSGKVYLDTIVKITGESGVGSANAQTVEVKVAGIAGLKQTFRGIGWAMILVGLVALAGVAVVWLKNRNKNPSF